MLRQQSNVQYALDYLRKGQNDGSQWKLYLKCYLEMNLTVLSIVIPIFSGFSLLIHTTEYILNMFTSSENNTKDLDYRNQYYSDKIYAYTISIHVRGITSFRFMVWSIYDFSRFFDDWMILLTHAQHSKSLTPHNQFNIFKYIECIAMYGT